MLRSPVQGVSSWQEQEKVRFSLSGKHEPPLRQLVIRHPWKKWITSTRWKVQIQTDWYRSKARFIRRISAVSNAIEAKDNEANHLIIYCRNCIRHGTNATYESGLTCTTFFFIPSFFSFHNLLYLVRFDWSKVKYLQSTTGWLNNGWFAQVSLRKVSLRECFVCLSNLLCYKTAERSAVWYFGVNLLEF